jgi:nitrite reductase/ring-hydroxylating ferredoxin subunit
MGTEISAGPLSKLPDGGIIGVDLSGHKVCLAREGDTVYAVVNKCPHMGLSLTKGPAGPQYDEGVIQCPWHNSRFEMQTGKNIDWVAGIAGRKMPQWSTKLIRLGKKPADLTVLPARVADGEVFVTVD